MILSCLIFQECQFLKDYIFVIRITKIVVFAKKETHASRKRNPKTEGALMASYCLY